MNTTNITTKSNTKAKKIGTTKSFVRVFERIFFVVRVSEVHKDG